MLTAERIEQANKEKQTQALNSLFEDCSFNKKETSDKTVYHIATKTETGEIMGVVFETAAKGYGGKISVMTAISLDRTVLGVKCVDISGETVGLGQKASEKSFLDQFIGLVEGIKVNKNTAGENEIVAITGATITSKAVTDAVNDALAHYDGVVFEIALYGGAAK
jgi:electron transport complex protein RnfG